MDQKGEKQSKSKRIKKTPLLWKSFPETDAYIDLAFFCENSDINGPLSENQSHQAGLPISKKKTLWKVLPKSEPCIDISFFAETIETKNVSMPAEEHEEVASLKKKSYSENTVISTTQIVTKEESILKPQETLDQKGEKHPSLGKPMDNIQTGNLTEVSVNQAEENVQGEDLTKIQNLPHSPEKTSQAKCICEVKCKESELEHMEVQKYLMQLLDDMFDVNQKLNAKLQQLKDLTRKLLSERRQRKKTMVSVQTQSESQDTSPEYQCASVQMDMDVPETRCHLKPVRQTISTQTEMDVLETRFHLEPVYKTISTQTELFLLLRKQPTETKMNGNQDRQNKVFKRSTDENRRESAARDASELKAVGNENISGVNIEKELSVPEIVGDQAETIENEIHTNETAIVEVLQVIEEETVTITQQNGDHQDEKKRSTRSKRKIKRKVAKRDASELEAVNEENISGENIEKELSVPEIVGDQAETIENKIHTNETAIGEVLQVIEEETVSITQQNGDHQDEKKRSTRSKRKIKRK
ncbi:uncharacterized protein LOC107835480, partial [Poecilia formosa]|uniref:uncharacterized protein LOC107835480 n=1 Tax=Poecilia formosa TaxID=48698 RepID=UPI0007B9EDB4